MPEVALVTCAALPNLDEDERLLPPALRELGVTAVPAIWDDPAVDWTSFAMAVVRCPWDYQHRRSEFLDWADTVPRLHNPGPVLAWNTDKRYLRVLAEAGIPVVSTTWLSPGEPVRLPAEGDWVLKPSIGAGSGDAGRYRMDLPAQAEQAAAHVRRLHSKGSTVMLQPYLSDVDVNGEQALIYIDGEYSHSIRKSAMLSGPYEANDELFKPETITPSTATGVEQGIGRAVLAEIPGLQAPPLYARVDLIQGENGLVVLELELAEPSLFYAHGEGGAQRMAQAIAARL